MQDIIPQDNTPRKRCSKCKKFLPTTNEFFGKDKNAKDGLNMYCKDCRHTSRHLKRPDRGRHPRREPFTVDQKRQMCQRYIAGESTVAIARSYGIDKSHERAILV